MSIYISGFEMPKEKTVCLLVSPDGQAFVKSESGQEEKYQLMPVPPHGRLMDKDAFIDGCKALSSNDPHDIAGIELIKFFMEEIVPTPTIIPADNKEK